MSEENVERDVVREALKRLGRERSAAASRLEQVRTDLPGWLRRGAELGLTVTEMADHAAITRDAASRVLHHGSSWKRDEDETAG